MRPVREPFTRPREKERDRRKARRLEWVTIAFLLTAAVVLYVTMGASQVMKAALVEDILGLLPPIAVLVAARVADGAPTERFPYGYARSTSIAFIVGATALTAVGAFLAYDSAINLIAAEHPTIRDLELLGIRTWGGWWMIAALSYTVVGPVVLGRLKLPLAASLYNKALHTDAAMNRADWMTAVAGIVGVLGVGFGLWWADSVAALAIAGAVLKDGITNVRYAAADLMDQRPTSVDREEPLDLPVRIAEYLERLDWVERASVRLRDEGERLAGEAFVVPVDGRVSARAVDEAVDGIRALDWRLADVVVTPTVDLHHDFTSSTS